MHNGLILLSCVCVFWAEAVRVPVRQNEESLRVRIQDPSLGAQEVKLFKELNPTLLVRKQDELVARAIKNIEENSGVHDKEKERILKNYLDQLRRIGEEGYSDIRNKNLDFHQRKVENEGGDAGVAETTKVSKSEGTFDKFYKEPLPDWTTSAQTKQNKEQSEESEEDPYNVEPKGYQQDPDTVLNVRKKKKKRIAPKKSEEEHDVEKPKSYHEDPGPVATRVNYPGQGQWVRRDTRHKPHVTIHKHLYPENVDERGQFEIFDHNKNIYDEEREGYYNDLKKYADNYNTDATNHEEEPQDFVPYRSYSQTRRSEIESRIPRKPKKNKSKRLKEIQKNSKAHTVYTEEGYEDSAYDHGGSEKRGDKLEKDRRVYEEGEGIKEKETRPEAPETSEYEDNREDESETDEVSKRDSFEPERDESESNIKKRRVRKEEIPRR